MANQVNNIKIILHNVLKWTYRRKNELSNYYQQQDPDVILLNSTGIKADEKIKLFNYNIHQRNIYNEDNAGIAIAIKSNIKYQLIDTFQYDILAIKLETNKGPVIIATTYLPPRRQYLPEAELRSLFQKTIPVYMMADLNANHRNWGYAYNNQRGIMIGNMIRQNICSHIGPDFNTLINVTGVGRPDIILGNRRAFFHTAIREGNLTSSDHLPIVINISTKPLLILSPPKWNLSKTNWDTFKENIEIKMQEQMNMLENINENEINKDIIEENYKKWMENIVEGIDRTTPKRVYKLIRNFKESDLLKLIEEKFRDIRNYAIWSRETIRETRILQDLIIEESMRLTNENWENKISNLKMEYIDPARFWKSIKQMKGGNSETITYLLDEDNNNNKIHKTEEQIKLFHKHWQNIFQISEEENRTYDAENDQRINNIIGNNPERYKPFERFNNRLDVGNPLTMPVTKNTIRNIVKSFKNNKAPGSSGINKLILVNLPDNAYETYIC